MTLARSFRLPFIKREQISAHMHSFYFDRRGVDFDFSPGQYIRMYLPHEEVDDRGTTRFFTIASSPHERKHILITTKVPQSSLLSSFKESLFALQPGSMVEFFGPMGTLILDENDLTDRVFIAGGIGMTPFHSMVTYAAAKRLIIPITLIASFSNQDGVFFYEEFRKIACANQSIRIVYTLTNTATKQNWRGETGKVSEALLKKYISDITNPIYSIVGPTNFVTSTTVLLQCLGVVEEKIKIEEFSGY